MPETLATYPYVVVRLACRMCPRRGQYRLARLAAEHGAEIEMTELLERLAGKCRGRDSWSPGIPPCGAYFVDLASAPRPPDLPPAVQKPRLVK